jgi:hypothetical protein
MTTMFYQGVWSSPVSARTPDGTYIRFPTSRIDPRPEVRLPARTRIPMGM